MVSIRDVAEHAGVAISTVSKVINNYPNVSASTKKRVRDAIHELNYIPNTLAAALSSKQAGRAAILISINTQTTAIDEISMQYLHGALNMALKLNIEIITIFISSISHMTSEEITRYLESQGISGIIVIGMTKNDTFLSDLINSEVFKTVVVDVPLTNINTSSICIDNAQAQYDVAWKTISEHNYNKVLYISGPDNRYTTDERLAGIMKLKKEKGLEVLVKCGENSELKARELAFEYAENNDFVVCASDLMAIGAMNALVEMDIFRPVCGFDGLTLMGYVGKQMNTIKQDFYNIASNSVQELKRLFEGEEGHRVILPYELVRLEYMDVIR